MSVQTHRGLLDTRLDTGSCRNEQHRERLAARRVVLNQTSLVLFFTATFLLAESRQLYSK